MSSIKMEAVPNSQGNNLVSDVKKQVEDLIISDKKPEFVAYVQSQLEKERRGISKVELCPSELLMSVCSHCALDCATALLEGETGFAMDLNAAFRNGLYPMHYAAQSLSLGLTELLLRHGASVDLHCSDDCSKYSGMSPLCLALETICKKEFLLDWAPHKSIFKLIYILCLPELREPLETIKLLALNTQELPVISSCIAQEGRLHELGILLMVAREKLIKPVGSDVSYIEQCIMRELQLIIDEEFKLMGSSSRYSKLIRMCKRRKRLMLSAAVMLDVFDLAGGILDKYRLSERIEGICRYRLAVEVATCLKVLGFNLKRKDVRVDDISCFLTKLGSKQAGILNRRLQEDTHFLSRGKKVVSTRYEYSPTVYCVQLGPFHTYLFPKAGMDNKLCDSATSRTIRTQLVEPSFSKLLNGKGWAAFASTLQRRIRFI